MTNNFLLSHRREEPEKGILYMVGTPIGNLDDIYALDLEDMKIFLYQKTQFK